MVDNWLFDHVFEKFSRWFQRLTGRNCFWLAKIFFALVTVFAGVSGFVLEVPVVLIVAAIAVLGLLTAQTFRNCDILETFFQKNPGWGNPLRAIPDMIAVRILSLSMCSVAVGFTAFSIFYMMLWNVGSGFAILSVTFASLTAHAYFLSCTPLPPQKSKVRKWIEQARARWQKEPDGDALPA